MSVVHSFKPVAKKNDFWHQVGFPSRGVKLHNALHEGLPFSVYSKLAEISGLEKAELANAATIPSATLSRRSKLGRFNKEESDKLYRFAEVFKTAADLFDSDYVSATQWLKSPVVGLGNKRPIDMLSTSAETEAVLDLIGRLEHGVFS
ncbi:MAG: DUF2384 domain-containing protein [Aliivibrio sp.]|uniref:type II RES/Xre toxin-antitoxin system antitoxin n=1 Tax=Aliivibrio sp. TaxID=1872443 RepID=UPI001A3DBF1A|nr:DUF2384 domain-containing protein [Aliivibrio sp.]